MRSRPSSVLSCLQALPVLCLAWPFRSAAAPEGMTVQSGSASASSAGQQLNITASHNAVLNWQSFNIAPGETTRFIQPSASSVVWNQIHDQNASQIYGHLEANGVVVLMNRSGFYFGPNSFVNAAGLVISTAPAAPIESSAGLFWQFSGPPPLAKIVNYGQLSATRGGSLFLISADIENHGTLSAPEGHIGLLAGRDVLLSSRPDGRALSASVTLPEGSIDNSGRMVADAGTIALNARVVNQDGLIQANSVRERNGVIELVASESVHLGEHSALSANGDDSAATAAGRIDIKSSGSFSDVIGSKITVAGGSAGGDGGQVEISAPQMSRIESTIDGHAVYGSRGGRLIIDPQDIVIGYGGADSAGSGSVGSGTPPAAGTLNLDVSSAFTGFSQIDLQATRNITLAGGTAWDLVESTGLSSPGSLLKLEAGNNITLAAGSSILAGENWSVTLQAGRNFSSADTVTPGTGSILFTGSASIEARNGDIQLLAGNNITVRSGFVRTIEGGSITARAVSGSVNTGTATGGFRFYSSGTLADYQQVDTELGGISTAHGGDVTLSAGLDVVSYLPVPGGPQGDAGSGAFGTEAGDVSVTAGRDVIGHFVVRNGDGSIHAGNNAGTSATKLLALSVSDGGWTVTAGNDILLQEVRNPNGIFNNVGFGASPSKHLFDYSQDSYTVLQAGRGVELRGTSLPRASDDAFEQGITPMYPSRLEISAGSGGVRLGSDITLFPSPIGNLRIATSAGGSLQGPDSGDLVRLVLSDSGSSQYRAPSDFDISAHAPTPLHLNDAEPVRLDIAGDMKGIVLGVPKRAEVTVGGSMINTRFDGQNLHARETTFLHVGGDILNRNEFTSVTLADAPDFGVFDLVYPPLSGNAAGVQNLFSYDATSHTLTFQGRMKGDQLSALLALRVRTFDANGLPIIGPDGEPVTRPATFASSAALEAVYTASQDVPSDADTGYRLGGGGTFDVQAHTLDLGATVGIVSQGPRGNAALAQQFTHGADIRVALSGDLDMFSTKIASLNGGSVSVTAEGDVNVGSRTLSIADTRARGIFTTDPSDITVIARGDINLNGSRIAAYDGGDIVVRSLEGNVDAGTGGRGAAMVEKIYVDPVTRQVLTDEDTIPGSGILATSFPRSLNPAFPRSETAVGNILIETPRGDIIASKGGVVQIPLNGVGANAGRVTLNAGSRDADGNVIYEGNIDASGSGVIGSTVELKATGNIQGQIFARSGLDIAAVRNVDVNAHSNGDARVDAGGSVKGHITGIGNLSTSGESVSAVLLSQNVSTSGKVEGGQVGFAQANVAAATSQSLQKEEPAKKVASADPEATDAKTRKPRELPVLTRTVGRVTVILPTAN